MKKLLFLVLLFSLFQSYGQDKFNYNSDFKKILAATKDSNSTLFYPKLLKRFNTNDSTLTDNEVLSLMIGFTDNPLYRPYATIDDERDILNLVSEKKYKQALNKCNDLLKTNPLNYSALMEKGFALWKLNDDSMAFHKSKYLKIYSAIKSSGDGSRSNAYFVLSPIDGQTLIRYVWQGSIGIMGSASDPNGNFLDMLEMKKEGEEPWKLYFNIQHAVGKMF